MNTEIEFHSRAVKTVKEQERTNEKVQLLHFANPLPQCSESNQRIHMDLFRPLKKMPPGKKFILCAADAFLKYAELVV